MVEEVCRIRTVTDKSVSRGSQDRQWQDPTENIRNSSWDPSGKTRIVNISMTVARCLIINGLIISLYHFDNGEMLLDPLINRHRDLYVPPLISDQFCAFRIISLFVAFYNR